jgi:hypothetical protein
MEGWIIGGSDARIIVGDDMRQLGTERKLPQPRPATGRLWPTNPDRP